MKKRYVSLILAAALSAAALAGCGGSGTEAPGSKETTGKEAAGQASAQDAVADGELSGEITFWHSFTQGPRLETIQKAADKFMAENPDVKINIETFSWNDFYTKWTTGLAS